jgi:hypothetical protein
VGVHPGDGAGLLAQRPRGTHPLHRGASAHTPRGFSPAQAYYGYHALDGHAVGFTMWELGHAVPDKAVVEQLIRQIESGAFPYLLEHARQHDADHPQSRFEFGLDLIFDRLRCLPEGKA